MRHARASTCRRMSQHSFVTDICVRRVARILLLFALTGASSSRPKSSPPYPITCASSPLVSSHSFEMHAVILPSSPTSSELQRTDGTGVCCRALTSSRVTPAPMSPADVEASTSTRAQLSDFVRFKRLLASRWSDRPTPCDMPDLTDRVGRYPAVHSRELLLHGLSHASNDGRDV